MQAPAPRKKTDWSSMAASLIPAVIGGVSGGPMGALAGMGKGMGDIAQKRKDVEEYKREQAMKEDAAERQQEQLRINQQYATTAKQRLSLDEQKQQTLETQIEEQMKYQRVQTEQLGMEVALAKRSRTARENLRVNMKDPAERVLFDADPEGWMEERREKIKLQGSGPILESIVTGIPKGQGQKIAEQIGTKGYARILEAHVKAKANPQKTFSFVPSPDAGGGFLVNGLTGVVTFKKFDNVTTTKTDMNQASVIHDDAYKDVIAQFKTGPMGAINMDKLGTNPQEIQQKLLQMVDERAIQIAAARGRPDLFSGNAPDMLADALATGEIKYSVEAIMFLLSRGVPPDQVEDMAREIFRRAVAAQIKKKIEPPPKKPTGKRPLKELWASDVGP